MKCLPLPHWSRSESPWLREDGISESHSGSHLPTWPHDLSLLAPGTELRGGKMSLLSKNKGRFLNIFLLPWKQLLSSLPKVTTILSPFQLTERKARHPGTTSQQHGCKALHSGPRRYRFERYLSLTSVGIPPAYCLPISFSFSLHPCTEECHQIV